MKVEYYKTSIIDEIDKIIDMACIEGERIKEIKLTEHEWFVELDWYVGLTVIDVEEISKKFRKQLIL